VSIGGPSSGVFHPHQPGIIVDSANQLSDLAKGELRSWLEPWFQPRGGASTNVIASIDAVISAPATLAPGSSLISFDTIESADDTTGTFTLSGGGVVCGFAGIYMFSSFCGVSGGVAPNLVAMLRRGAQEFGRSYMPGGFGNISVTAALAVNAGDRVTSLIYQDAATNQPLPYARIVGMRL
jgi:hypothetical protein